MKFLSLAVFSLTANAIRLAETPAKADESTKTALAAPEAAAKGETGAFKSADKDFKDLEDIDGGF